MGYVRPSYTRKNWRNNQAPAINQANLNSIDDALLDIIDNLDEVHVEAQTAIEGAEEQATRAMLYADEAETSAQRAALSGAEGLKSEGYATGTQDGVPVDEDSPYHHNNAKYYSEQTHHGSWDTLLDKPFTTIGTGLEVVNGALSLDEEVIEDVEGIVSDAWNSTTTYAKDDYCIYNNILYRVKAVCTNVVPPNETYYEAVTVADEIGALKTSLANRLNIDLITYGTIAFQYDYNDIVDNGIYYMYNSSVAPPIHNPTNSDGFMLVLATNDKTNIIQLYICRSNGYMYSRGKQGGTWTEWRIHQGTTV